MRSDLKNRQALAILHTNLIEERASLYVENSTRILFEAFDTHFISAALLKPGGENEAASTRSARSYGNLVPLRGMDGCSASLMLFWVCH
ncbi:hypothetical protein OSTOST_19002 [Ostertagia ostertagi]